MIRNVVVLVMLALGCGLAAAPALAHKVLASAYPSGTVIEGQIGFSNGDMAKDAKVEVTGPDGAPLGETVTDEQGSFTFTPSQPVAHVFTADLGAGHLAQFTLPAEDVAQVLALQGDPGAKPSAPSPGGVALTGGAMPSETPGPASGAMTLSRADELAIAKLVRDEIRPLTREIAAYKEHNGLQTILGGIGYIIGLFGIGFYVAARRRTGR